jgi:tRNA (cmo5U34)-methyltransferase
MEPQKRDLKHPTAQWAEIDSGTFIQLGEVFTVERSDIQRSFLDLIPFSPEQDFTFYELCTGAGWLSRTILEHFSRARAIGIDTSEAMLGETAKQLRHIPTHRWRLEQRNIEEFLNPTGFTEKPDLVVSSLAVHHLFCEQKQQLFKSVQQTLRPGGAFLIFDLVQPRSLMQQNLYARTWNEVVQQQGENWKGTHDPYQVFQQQEWNYYEHLNDPIDHPSTLFEQLNWMNQSGLRRVDCFYLKAGHALYGGYV